MQVPLFSAKTEWCAPTSFPDLSSYDEIAIDLETKDPDLVKKGSCSTRGGGAVVGIAVAVKDWCGYYPIAHEGGGNMDRKRVLKWFKDVLKTPAKKIFHNAVYDVCWIKRLGLTLHGTIIDTMIMASLINENKFKYDLNSVAKEYTGIGKNEAALQSAAREWGIDPNAEMYKLPSMFVGEYAERDAEITLALWQEFKKEIASQNLHSIVELETDVLPCVVEMKWKGVRINEDQVAVIEKKFKKTYDECLKSVKAKTGIFPEVWAARSIAKVCEKLGVKDMTRTEKTNAPSFTKNYLSNHKHRLIRNIATARVMDKLRNTFIETLKNYVVKGRIHADINQLRGDQGGTLTGRLSYSHPNLQQLPNYNEFGTAIRSIFSPNSDEEKWGCFDYSQQEPRLVVHYASLQNLMGVDKFVTDYKENKKADFHGMVSDMANIPREQAKTINLAKFYGMGKAKMSESLKVSLDRAGEIIKQYDQRVPFVKQLTYKVSDRAQERGRIRTLLGRACRFPLWEPASYGLHTPLPHKQALAEHGPGIKRAFTYKALNKLIQGSAADMTKKAMIELYKNGIIPLIQVHDELDISVPRGDKAKIKQISGIMEDCVKLEVPNKVDYEGGNNWGQITDQ